MLAWVLSWVTEALGLPWFLLSNVFTTEGTRKSAFWAFFSSANVSIQDSLISVQMSCIKGQSVTVTVTSNSRMLLGFRFLSWPWWWLCIIFCSKSELISSAWLIDQNQPVLLSLPVRKSSNRPLRILNSFATLIVPTDLKQQLRSGYHIFCCCLLSEECITAVEKISSGRKGIESCIRQFSILFPWYIRPWALNG